MNASHGIVSDADASAVRTLLVPRASTGMHGLLLAVERLHRSLQQAIEELLTPHALSLSQWLTICAVAEEGGRTLTHLARQLDRDAGSLSRAVYLLSQRGLLSPLRNPHDRRSSRLSLTPEGQRIHQDVAPRIARLLVALDATQAQAGQSHVSFSPVLDDLAARIEQCRQRTPQA
ncbi:MarR family transcriptional regulator [Rhodanobacter fulvus Jip2]|uniref:MarR family transcriptional regulator n=1 Tax=Rhodanobacter fulvus Jip2 TaxID=1163408 RepID=I4VSS4_9GAMM|nr:MarR family transcriptional regulator [Rhodanobacter fulvus Jip2]